MYSYNWTRHFQGVRRPLKAKASRRSQDSPEIQRPHDLTGKTSPVPCLKQLAARAWSDQGPVGWPNGLLGWLGSKSLHVPIQAPEASLMLRLLPAGSWLPDHGTGTWAVTGLWDVFLQHPSSVLTLVITNWEVSFVLLLALFFF